MNIPTQPTTQHHGILGPLPTQWYGVTAPNGATDPWNVAAIGSLYIANVNGTLTIWAKSANNGTATDWTSQIHSATPALYAQGAVNTLQAGALQNGTDQSSVLVSLLQGNSAILFPPGTTTAQSIGMDQTAQATINRNILGNGYYVSNLQASTYASQTAAQRNQGILRFYNVPFGTWVNRINVDGIHFIGRAHKDAIYIDAASEVRIVTCAFTGARRAIALDYSDKVANNVRIRDCISYYCGIALYMDAATDVFIEDCLFNYGGMAMYITDMYRDIHIEHGHYEGNQVNIWFKDYGLRPSITRSWFYDGHVIIDENVISASMDIVSGYLGALFVDHGIATRIGQVYSFHYGGSSIATNPEQRHGWPELPRGGDLPTIEFLRENLVPDGNMNTAGSSTAWTAYGTATKKKWHATQRIFPYEVLYVKSTASGDGVLSTSFAVTDDNLILDVFVQTQSTSVCTVKVYNQAGGSADPATDTELLSITLASPTARTSTIPQHMVHRLTPFARNGASTIYVRITPANGEWAQVHLCQVFRNLINPGTLDLTNVTGTNCTPARSASGGRTGAQVAATLSSTLGGIRFAYTKPAVGAWVVPGGWIKAASAEPVVALGTAGSIGVHNNRQLIGSSYGAYQVLSGTWGDDPSVGGSLEARVINHETGSALLTGPTHYPFGGMPMQIQTDVGAGLVVGGFANGATYTVSDCFVYEIFPTALGRTIVDAELADVTTDIGALAVGATYTQAEVVALRNACEELRDGLNAALTTIRTHKLGASS